jgi:hypothetical protein
MVQSGKPQKMLIKKNLSHPPLKKPNNTWTIEDPVKTDIFKTYPAEVFKPHGNINNPAFSNEIENFLIPSLQITQRKIKS